MKGSENCFSWGRLVGQILYMGFKHKNMNSPTNDLRTNFFQVHQHPSTRFVNSQYSSLFALVITFASLNELFSPLNGNVGERGRTPPGNL